MAVSEPELLRAIIEAPEDEEPVLVYIDWLLERGDPRGEWIRLELAVRRGDPADELSARHRDLATRRTPELERLVEIVEFMEHRHALVRKAQLDVRAFVEHGGWILDHFPIGEFVFVDTGSEGIARLAACPHLARVHTLTIGSRLTADNAATLAASPHLALRGLELGGDVGDGGIGIAGLRALATAPGLANLNRLALADQALGVLETVEVLANLPALTTLEVDSNGLPERAVIALTSLERLTGLVLGNNSVTRDAIRALARMPALRLLALGPSAGRGELAVLVGSTWPMLTRLALRGMGLRASDVVALVEAPLFARLTALQLDANPIGDAGAIAIATSPRSRSLRTLGLSGCGILAPGARALAASEPLRTLETLEVFGNKIARARDVLAAAFGPRLIG